MIDRIEVSEKTIISKLVSKSPLDCFSQYHHLSFYFFKRTTLDMELVRLSLIASSVNAFTFYNMYQASFVEPATYFLIKSLATNCAR